MRKCILFLITMVLTLAAMLPAMAQENKVYLPVVEKSVALCEFYTDTWFLHIKIYSELPVDDPLYVYNHVFPSKPRLFREKGDFNIGDKRLAPAMAIRWLEGNVGFKTECSIGSPFDPAPQVGKAGDIGIFDRATVQVVKTTETATYYSIACIYHGDHSLKVTGLLTDQDTQQTRTFTWHEATDDSVILPIVDCAASKLVKVMKPEALTSVNFKTETDDDTVTEDMFFRFFLSLPIIVKSEPLEPKE